MLFNLFLLVNICFFVLYLIIEIHIDEGKSFNFSFRPEAFSLAKSLFTVAGDTNLFLGVTKSRPREGALWFSQCAHVDTTAWPLGTFNSQPAGVQLAPRPEAAIIISARGFHRRLHERLQVKPSQTFVLGLASHMKSVLKPSAVYTVKVKP